MTVQSGAGLTRSGFSFAGWNTAADGSGTGYTAGETFIVNADITLYARWTADGSVSGGDNGSGEINLADPSHSTGTGWTYADNVFTIYKGSAITVTGTTRQNRVFVNGGAGTTITLDSASIILPGGSASPVDLAQGANVTLKLKGASTLTAFANPAVRSGPAAGVHVTTGRTLTITSADGDGKTSGSLTATGGWSGAGIGGNQGEDGGTITIAGGSVYAKGYFSPTSDGTNHENAGAGIGGGAYGASGDVSITGGTGKTESYTGPAGRGSRRRSP